MDGETDMLGRWTKVGFPLLVVLGISGGQVEAGINDTATAWWHFNYASSGLIADANQIRDARTCYTPGGYKGTSLYGTPQGTSTAFGDGPAGGQNYGGRSLLFTPAADGSGNVTTEWVDRSNLTLAGASPAILSFSC